MADARYRLPASDWRYGPICPSCASPKSPNAARCKDCYRDDQLAGLARETCRRGPEHPNWIDGRRLPGVPRQRKGGSTGRQQPQDHPWRKRYKLLGKTA